jgi:hypothetical protein
MLALFNAERLQGIGYSYYDSLVSNHYSIYIYLARLKVFQICNLDETSEVVGAPLHRGVACENDASLDPMVGVGVAAAIVRLAPIHHVQMETMNIFVYI